MLVECRHFVQNVKIIEDDETSHSQHMKYGKLFAKLFLPYSSNLTILDLASTSDCVKSNIYNVLHKNVRATDLPHLQQIVLEDQDHLKTLSYPMPDAHNNETEGHFFYIFYKFRNTLTHLVMRNIYEGYEIIGEDDNDHYDLELALPYLLNFPRLTHLTILHESYNFSPSVDSDMSSPLVFHSCQNLVSLVFKVSFVFTSPYPVIKKSDAETLIIGDEIRSAEEECRLKVLLYHRKCTHFLSRWINKKSSKITSTPAI